ncbi:dimethylamine monooxygenase subunit DmmA family protein [Blastococcus sp. SYSU D00820]
MTPQHSSVPRWPAAPEPVDPAGRTVSLVGFGAAGAAVVREWEQQARPGSVVAVSTAERADDAALAELAGQVARARVGWRLMLAGPEVDVLAARAVVTGLGLLDAEIRVAVTSTERRRVHCAHCRTTTDRAVPVGGELPCAGCGRRLQVHGHVSRRTGTYLGSTPDAAGVA